jgi:hypothetical protein
MSTSRSALRIPPVALLVLLALAHCSGGSGSGGVGGGGSGSVKVGYPCLLADELDPSFPGFRITEESIESGTPECGGGVCLVNHFQGRVTCPLGQPDIDGKARRSCTGPADVTSCDGAKGEKCVASDASAAEKHYVCHKPGSCQAQGASDQGNRDAAGAPKDCCVPGTDTPIEAAVCGQCDAKSERNADSAVYCSCRCGPPDGATAAPGDTFCGCPTGFQCSEIRKDFGLGDPHLAGKYCIKEGSEYTGNAFACGTVKGHFDSTCHGVAGL